MAAANDSQGLKIAVAVFVTLSVILSVTTYFSYQAYSQADAKFTKAEGELATAKRAQSDALNQTDALRKEIGLKAEDPDAIKTEIKNENKKNDDEIKSLVAQVNDVVAKAQAAGANGPELEDAKAKVQQIAAAYSSEPGKTYIASLDRLIQLMKNLALVTTQVSLNYTDVKRNLESSNSVNAQKLNVETDAVKKAKDDLTAEHEKHESERQSLLTRVDKYNTDNARMATEIANLTAKLRETEDDFSKRLAVAQQTIREYRDRVERSDTVLDRPDGKVTFVDYTRGEIHTNLTRTTGARPQMQLAIFDSQSPGIPTDKPKGTVTLIQVGDRESIARIDKTNSNIEPIRTGDIIYSAAWSPNDPMRFALIGKIDINRDGKDDRGDLKRMIEQSGGIVSYDLPPPDTGKETGKMTGREAWYVVDDRTPLAEVYTKSSTTATENADFLKKQSERIREARLNGVRPMPVERLLPYLGYDYAAPVRGRAEAVDTQSLKRVLAPRPDAEKAQPKQDATTNPADESK